MSIPQALATIFTTTFLLAAVIYALLWLLTGVLTRRGKRAAMRSHPAGGGQVAKSDSEDFLTLIDKFRADFTARDRW